MVVGSDDQHTVVAWERGSFDPQSLSTPISEGDELLDPHLGSERFVPDDRSVSMVSIKPLKSGARGTIGVRKGRESAVGLADLGLTMEAYNCFLAVLRRSE